MPFNEPTHLMTYGVYIYFCVFNVCLPDLNVTVKTSHQMLTETNQWSFTSKT